MPSATQDLNSWRIIKEHVIDTASILRKANASIRTIAITPLWLFGSSHGRNNSIGWCRQIFFIRDSKIAEIVWDCSYICTPCPHMIEPSGTSDLLPRCYDKMLGSLPKYTAFIPWNAYDALLNVHPHGWFMERYYTNRIVRYNISPTLSILKWRNRELLIYSRHTERTGNYSHQMRSHRSG